jgi:hypothetical protein
MLSPEQRADAVNWLRSEQLEYPSTCHRWRCIATALAALTNEAAIAEQVRVLREALEGVRAQWPVDYVIRITEIVDAALALELPDAARQAAENAEKAGLLEWLLLRGYAILEDDESDRGFTVLRTWQDKFKYATPDRWFDTPLDALRAAKELEAARG